MARIESDSWSDFTAQVAAATAAGHEVTIQTGPGAAGRFVASHDGPEPEAPKKAKAKRR